MQIITVAPILRGGLQGSLTYFSKDPIDIGMVVLVPIRTREVPAIVLSSQSVLDEKSALKSSDYAIRKIARTRPRRIWLPEFLEAVEATANFSAQKFGETLLALTPKVILDAHLDGTFKETKTIEAKGHFEKLAIQGNTEMRFDAYQRLVRESFVRHESVFVCLPTEEDVMRVSKKLGHGIEDYTFALGSSITKKRVLDMWGKILNEDHAILVVGTAQYLSIPRHFTAIVLDEEHSHAWKRIVRPQIDQRVFVEEYARSSRGKLIVGAPLLRAETHAQIKDGTVDEFNRISFHTQSDINVALINPQREEKFIRENTGRREMVILSKEVLTIIEKASRENEQVLLIAARKGLAPITSCGDCGTLVRCPSCDTPLVTHKKETPGGATNIFICHGCGFMRVPENNVNEVCPNCGGWKLQGVGISTNRIDDEVKAFFPDNPRFILDGEHAKTRTQARKIIDQFEKSKNGILVATPMVLPLLNTVPHTAVISIDSLFAIPDIRMSERIFTLVLALREKTKKTLLVQTRADDTSLLEQALVGNLLDFTENELSLRKAFSYPPYGTIIKITLRGKRADIANEMELLKVFLGEYTPIVPGTMAREPKNIYRMHMILKLRESVWVDKALLAKLQALPMQFTVEVNPDHLL